MSEVHRIYMQPVWIGGRSGYRYDLFHDDFDAPIVERSRSPLGDAARWCAVEGKNGKVEVWRYGGSAPAMMAEISLAAALTVSETDQHGPRVVKWKPFVMEQEHADD